MASTGAGIVALGQLVEALVLFDDVVVVPDLGHRRDVSGLVEPFGAAVSALPVESALADHIVEESRRWLASGTEVDLPDLVRLIGCVPTFDRVQWGGSGSNEYLLLAGARDKYSSEVVRWVRSIRSHGKLTPPRRTGGLDKPRGWRPSDLLYKLDL